MQIYIASLRFRTAEKLINFCIVSKITNKKNNLIIKNKIEFHLRKQMVFSVYLKNNIFNQIKLK